MGIIQTCQCQDSKYKDHLVPDEDTPMDPTSFPEPIVGASSFEDSLYPGLIQSVRDAQAHARETQARVHEANMRAERAYSKANADLAGFLDIFRKWNVPPPSIPDISSIPGSPLRQWLTNRHRSPR